MINHETEFERLRVGQRVNAVAEDGRLCMVVRLPSFDLGVDWGDGVTIEALPVDLRIRAITPTPDVDMVTMELQAVRDELRAVTAQRDQAQEDAVVILNAYGHRGAVSGEVMARVDGYKAAWVQRKSPPTKQVP